MKTTVAPEIRPLLELIDQGLFVSPLPNCRMRGFVRWPEDGSREMRGGGGAHVIAGLGLAESEPPRSQVAHFVNSRMPKLCGEWKLGLRGGFQAR